ncbi:MAG: hypothetical protein Q9222_003828 [Ikaeria aurantiellina]
MVFDILTNDSATMKAGVLVKIYCCKSAFDHEVFMFNQENAPDTPQQRASSKMKSVDLFSFGGWILRMGLTKKLTFYNFTSNHFYDQALSASATNQFNLTLNGSNDLVVPQGDLDEVTIATSVLDEMAFLQPEKAASHIICAAKCLFTQLPFPVPVGFGQKRDVEGGDSGREVFMQLMKVLTSPVEVQQEELTTEMRLSHDLQVLNRRGEDEHIEIDIAHQIKFVFSTECVIHYFSISIIGIFEYCLTGNRMLS